MPASPVLILIADDNTDAADSFEMILNGAGYSTVTAYTGTNAVKIGAEREPAIAFLDIGMPEMSGYEVARALRDRYGNSIALVALSGYGQPADVAAAKAAGFDHHFTKPADTVALLSLVAQLATARKTATPELESNQALQ